MKKQTSGHERYSRLSAACEPFRKAKTKTIHTLAGIGQKHTILRYPIMAFVFVYNMIIYGCSQLKVRERFARCLALVMTAVLVFVSLNGTAFVAEAESDKLMNGSFEEEQTWTKSYNTQSQSAIPSWNTTASDGQIEMFRENYGVYITGVTLAPTAGSYAAELNANEESTLYQNVKTSPSSIYEWGLDHGARNGTDTMALVIGPKQSVNPSKPSKDGRDQLMQMVDWLIEQGKTSVKTTAGLGEQLIVYSKKFAESGTFEDNAGNNAFSLTPSTIYTEEWHIWIMASSKATSGTNPWEKYGSNAEGSAENTGRSGNTEVDLSKYYLYTVPAGQTETLFGFVSVGFDQPSTTADKAKTYGNFLDNINFELYHPLSSSTSTHGSAVVGGSDGTVGGEGGSDGHAITVDNKLTTYVTDGQKLRIQAVVKRDDANDGCEFVGVYYTTQDENGNPKTVLLQKAGNEIDYSADLTDEQKKGKWIKSTNSDGDTIYTYYLEELNSATDLHFVFIKSPTVTYDPNGGKAYTVERTYNTDEAANVYSYKPHVDGETYKFISPYVSHKAEGQNDGWKFMGWLLTGDTVDPADFPDGATPINANQLGTLLLEAEHTIACDYTGDSNKKEQYFKIWNGNISLTKSTDNCSFAKWETNKDADYANVHKGLPDSAKLKTLQRVSKKSESSHYIFREQGGVYEREQ